MRWGHVARNVAASADLPKGMAPEMHVWSPDQLRVFLDHARRDRLYAAWLLFATTGMRRGELAGLRWPDVDLDANRISPRRPRVVVNYEVHVSEPKTAKGRRSLALDPATVAALRQHKARQAEERLAVGPRWHDSGLVFTWPDGRPIHPQRLSTWFEQLARAAGLPRIRLHDVRHSYASAALAAGIPGQGRLRAPRARHHCHNDGHLQPRAPRPGRQGRRHGRQAHPGRPRARAGASR